MADVSPVEVQGFLGGIDYPAGKDDVIDTARRNGADEDVLSALDSIPDREYSGADDVTAEISG